MAKNRMVSTSFWSDNYITELDPTEKLLFLYLLTNERSTLGGIYELPAKVMAVETGIETEMVKKILGRFQDEGKIKYENGVVAIKNFLKHHEQGSPTVKKAIETTLSVSPEWAKSFVGKGIDTLSPSASASASALKGEASLSQGMKFSGEKTNVPDLEEETKIDTRRVKDKETIYYLFSKKKQPWWDFAQERKAALSLFDLLGEEKVRAGLEFCREYEDDEYCPHPMTPYEYGKALPGITRYKKRKGL